MGAGIALQVYNNYSQAWMADQLTTVGDKQKLGTYTFAVEPHVYYPERKVTIVNAYTQYRYTSYEVDVDYGAVHQVLNSICEDFDNEIFSLPKIGCGLAGGDWAIIMEILMEISNEHGKDFRVYIYP
jgi:hypothetical protein